LGRATLGKIIQTLTEFYLSPVSVEHGHIDDPPSRLWIQKAMESDFFRTPLPQEAKLKTLNKLIEAEVFETFLHKRFVGQKRFSVEGCDVLIPMLDYLIEYAAQMGADEIIFGMAHRGRLNVLANIFQKDLKRMLGEFSGLLDANVGDGDVKYHMGFSQGIQTSQGKKVHLSLMPNPSHLEAICPVLMGVARSKQKLKGDENHQRTLPVLLHGDASFTGQGVIYEVLNMSDLPGYTVGGTIHIIVNNQIGFTTNPQETRSTPQATDVATMMEFPIFHVNADEPEAALRCISLALDFRYKFKKDVVIDVIGYRRYGHNEADEPTFTQPLLYKVIHEHPRVRDIYQQKLIDEGSVQPEVPEKMVTTYTERLDQALQEAKLRKISPMMDAFGDKWKGLHKPSETNLFEKIPTAVKLEKLKEVGLKLMEIPADFHLHPKIEKVLEQRKEILTKEDNVDWSFAEALAFSTLLSEGHRVRLSGQDTERGTFSQRHSVYHDTQTGQKFNPYNHLAKKQVDFEVINSLLSEYGALGFEFGQSIAHPDKLVLWEAQFGDFINGAQIIVDQFLVSSAFKWNRFSGLVLLLPHGYEGQGPEHSSAHLGRFLKACAQNNIQVCNLTTPVQYFHVLRRQILRKFRIPLVIMTPKSLLRHPKAVSPLKDFQDQTFHELLDDDSVPNKNEVGRIIFCSGKLFYELEEGKKKSKDKEAIKKIAIVRVEQFYPFPEDQYRKILASYPHATEVVWCQEGPQNMEGYGFMLHFMPPHLNKSQKFIYAGRMPQASPADSYLHLHQQEQKRIVSDALGGIS
jgi:2-oxoglutarate dehydrogenase E1 component